MKGMPSNPFRWVRCIFCPAAAKATKDCGESPVTADAVADSLAKSNHLGQLNLDRPLILLNILLDGVEVRVERSYLCLEVLVELCPRTLLRSRDGLDLRAQSDHFRAQIGDSFLSRIG